MASDACDSNDVVDLLRLLHSFVVVAVAVVVLFCCNEAEWQRAHEEAAVELAAMPRLPAGAHGGGAGITGVMLSSLLPTVQRPGGAAEHIGGDRGSAFGTPPYSSKEAAVPRRTGLRP